MQAITSFIEKRKSLFLRIAAVVLPLIVLTVLIAPTVFAQTTYVITDGDQVITHTSYATNPEDVLARDMSTCVLFKGGWEEKIDRLMEKILPSSK